MQLNFTNNSRTPPKEKKLAAPSSYLKAMWEQDIDN
jgi:hypothetical protein